MKARVHPLRQKLRGEDLRVPGDKSISHRALLFASLAEGESRIAGLAPGGDVRSTARCLAQLGVPLLRGDGTPWSAQPVPSRPAGSLPLPEHDPDMGPDDAIVFGVGLRRSRRSRHAHRRRVALAQADGARGGAASRARRYGDDGREGTAARARREGQHAAGIDHLEGGERAVEERGAPRRIVHGG
ncbi:MAG: hypothetical protein E6J62_21240 [Deltaproteobacteria bacterium]|nr:MAG: hypothetical protein E6J62_21240 [Deltaproteobacteria bacterium]